MSIPFPHGVASPEVSSPPRSDAAARLLEGVFPIEPAHAVEPLPPLDDIHPEHIAYVRVAVARFSVTPTHCREDIVQETLFEAHRSRDSRLEVRALLHGITRHVVFRWRAKRRVELALRAQLPGAEPATDRSAEDAWREEERIAVVRAALGEIPEDLRAVLVGVALEHKTMPELARELSIPLNTGYTRLHLARARFLEALRRTLARRRISGEDLL